MQLQFKRLPHGEGLPLPAYATPGSAAMDICAAESLSLYEDTIAMIKTGWACAIPEGYEIQCRPRSGLAAKHGLMVVNSPGTIDSDYRGEICVILMNTRNKTYHVNRGDRIAQLVLSPVIQAQAVEVNELDETQRGTGGFGSTGKN